MKEYTYLNNLSDIISISQEERFKELLDKIDNNKTINITSNLIHKIDTITSHEQFFFNLDNYITFIKNHLFINPFEIRIIVSLTIYNKYNRILYSDKYYYSNISIYEKEFIKMFMYNYEKNVDLIMKYINIKKRNFKDLITNINKHKKRSYTYFENINTSNMNFYIPIIKHLENVN